MKTLAIKLPNWSNKKEDKDENPKKFGEIIHSIGLPKLAIIMLCGIVIIVLSIPDIFSSSKGGENRGQTIYSNDSDKNENNSTTEEYTSELENRLKQMLMKVNEIGQVEVMITVKSSKEAVPLKDEISDEQTTEEQDSAGGSRKSSSVNKQEETVFDGSDAGNSKPYIIKELEPEIEGVLVIAEGGDRSIVKSEIVDAVMVLFNVPAHKIKVMKMNN